MIEYSEKEKELMAHFGYTDFSSQEPLIFYRTLAFDLFTSGAQGVAVESVRRCCHAFVNGNGPKRLTKEFEDLIKF